MGREGGPDGRTAGGGGLNKGFDEGSHNHIAAGGRREWGRTAGGGGLNKDVKALDRINFDSGSYCGFIICVYMIWT